MEYSPQLQDKARKYLNRNFKHSDGNAANELAVKIINCFTVAYDTIAGIEASAMLRKNQTVFSKLADWGTLQQNPKMCPLPGAWA